MRALNSIELNAAEMTVYVGAGALWQDVYDVLEPLNLSVLGGRVGDVGVAGLTLGGGISFFSPSRGWVCDSLVSVDIVLASGSCITALATSHPDLFTALKGGGVNNFGIVTRFEFRIFEQRPLWGGRITYESTSAVDAELMDAFYEYKRCKYDEDTGMWLCFARLRSIGLRLSYTTMWHAKPEEQPGNLGRFVDIGPQIGGELKVQYAGEMAKGLAEVSDTPDACTIWSTNTFAISPNILHSVYRVWNDMAESVGEEVDSMAYIQSFPPSPSPSNANSLGLPTDSHPERDYILFQAIFSYKDINMTEGLTGRMRAFVQEVDALAETEGILVDFKYANYAAGWQDLWEGGEELKERLRGVSKKYDPDGVLQRLVVGGWKLFD